MNGIPRNLSCPVSGSIVMQSNRSVKCCRVGLIARVVPAQISDRLELTSLSRR